MDEGYNSDESLGGSRIIQDYFETPKSSTSSSLTGKASSVSENCGVFQPRTEITLSSHDSFWAKKRRLRASFLRMFSLSKIPWGSDSDEKVELTKAEVESLRLEIDSAEERETHLKARLEHVDEILKSARLAGYLYIRTRWTALPWEPPVDDIDVDDWLQRFVVLHGPCIFLYLHPSDLSPQDSILLTEIVELGSLPSFLHEGNETRHSFSILTRHGLRYECSSSFKVQVDAWLAALKLDRNMDPNDTVQD